MQPDIFLNPRKEAVLTCAPFLSAFLDQKAVYDPDLWIANLSEPQQQIDSAIEGTISPEWKKLCAVPLAIFTRSLNVFNPNVPLQDIYGVTTSLVIIGYEIGDFQDAQLFLTDISLHLGKIEAFDPSSSQDQKLRKKADDIILGLLEVGTYLHDVVEAGGDILLVFIDNFDKLDF